MLFVGIDPGKHGAIAWMDGERKIVEVRDCPLKGKEYDFQQMAWVLRDVALADCACDQSTGIKEAVVTMEAVHSMPNDGKRQAFVFGKGYGAWLGIIGSLWLSPMLVDPRTWKAAMLTGIANSPKMEALALEQRFRGRIDPAILRGPQNGLKDGRVDALWLAEYGRTHWRPEQRRAA